MKKLCILLLAGFAFVRCNDTDTSSCSTYSTVRDLTGLDGCGFVFELADGSTLEPLRLWYCGTPSLPKEATEDPLHDFEFVDGKRVRIAYEETGNMSVCMVGPVVKITCIEEVATITED